METQDVWQLLQRATARNSHQGTKGNYQSDESF
jgi:hypothetical protein